MSWSSPRTWVPGEVASASQFNVHLRDNTNALRDYMLGAQDLGANFVFSSGRALDFTASGVGHGMTALVPTTTWGAVRNQSATEGGDPVRPERRR